MKTLDYFKKLGYIKDYSLSNIDENGEKGKESECRNTQELILVFPNNEKLIIETFCSGVLENTTLHLIAEVKLNR